MVSSNSTQNSKSSSLPRVQLTITKSLANRVMNYGPFAPNSSDARAMTSAALVGDTANTSNPGAKPPQLVPKSKLMFPKLNAQGLIQLGENDNENVIPPPQFIPSPPPPSMVDFVVKSPDDEDPGVRYHMVRSAPFFTIYNDYAERLGYMGTDINLKYGDNVVCPISTPDDIDLQDGDALVAHARFGIMNMDTHYKVFSIQDCADNPIKLHFKAKLRTSMATLVRVWAQMTGMDKDKVILVYDNKSMPQFGNVGQSLIKNQGLVYAWTLN